MQKQIKILLTLLITLALLVSCSNKNITSPNMSPNDNWVNDPNLDKLQFTWTQETHSSYNTNFAIATNNYLSKIVEYYSGVLLYSISIKYISWTSDTAGIIYGQYVYHKDDKSVIGKWYAIAFRNLTKTSIEISEASKQIATNPEVNLPIYDYSAETLEEAISKFTEANGYFNNYFNHKNQSSLIPVTSGVYTVHYGSKTFSIDVSDQINLRELWVDLLSNQDLYYEDYAAIKGRFDSLAHFHENWDDTLIREFIKCAVYEYNNKKILVGIYWNYDPIPSISDNYCLLIINESGMMEEWKGGGKDKNVQPDENTSWVQDEYYFVLGYLKNY